MSANSEATFILSGVKRVLNSAKVQTAAAALTASGFAIHYAAATLPPDDRSHLWMVFLGACYLLVREVLNGWTQEDVAAKSQPAPPIQVNTADTQNIAPVAAAPQSQPSDQIIPVGK